MEVTHSLEEYTPANVAKFDHHILQNFGYVYTAERAADVQNRWQALTSSRFVCAKATKGFGKNDFEDLLKHNLQWELASLGPVGAHHKGIDYDGIPFIVIATKLLDCQYGVDRHRKKKALASRPERSPSGRRWPRSSNKECRKVNCHAQMLFKDVLKFPGFRIRDKDTSKKAAASRKLRIALEENKNVIGERRFYMMLPMPNKHGDHPLSESSGMKSVQQAAPGGADTLMIDPVTQRPEPGEREILIEVFNSAVNRADILQRKAMIQPPKGASPIIGLEASGRIHKIGVKCSGKWKKGDRVMALLSGGGYAEYATVHEDHVMAIPDQITFAEAAAIPEVWLTAYQLLHTVGKVSKGECVLIHAGGSGVGTAAVQLAVLAGARPIVTAGSMDKVNRALDLGAVAGINYKDEQFPAKVLELTDGKGVNIILDCVGSTYWSKNMESLAVDGRWVLYGLLSGGNVKGNLLGGLLRKRVTLTATLLRPRSDEYKAQLVKAFEENALPLFTGIGDLPPRLKPILAKVFPLDQVQEAHEYVEASKNIGKVILRVKVDENEEQPAETDGETKQPTETTEGEGEKTSTEGVTDHGEL